MRQAIRYECVPNPFHLKLMDASGVATDSHDNIFYTTRTVSGTGAPVMMLDSKGGFVRGIGGNLLKNAHGIAVDREDNILVADPMSNCIFKFAQTGELLMTFGEPNAPLSTTCVNYDFNTIKQAAGPFGHPSKVAVSRQGDILVADGYGNAAIHRFKADGTYVKSFGAAGYNPGEFHIPHGIGVDQDNDDIYVADRENSRVQVFDADGQVKAIWKDIWRPTDIVIRDGIVYVAELGDMVYLDNVLYEPGSPEHRHHSQVRLFDTGGNELAQIGTADCGAAGSFFSAHGLCLDSAGNLYVGEVNFPREDLWISYPEGRGVSSKMHKALQKFEKKGQ
jgi:DNA-binding beta-propeller fold protein YncE